MPISADKLRGTDGDAFPVRPETNEYTLLSHLLDNRELAYTPKELAAATDVTYGSVYPSLQRLQEKGLVEKVDRYWMAAEDDRIGARTASLLGLQSVGERENEDEFSQNPDWADDLPDLGDNA